MPFWNHASPAHLHKVIFSKDPHAILNANTYQQFSQVTKDTDKNRRINTHKLFLQTEQESNTLYDHIEKQRLYLKKSVQSNQNALHG
jgi:hypothetical protein